MTPGRRIQVWLPLKTPGIEHVFRTRCAKIDPHLQPLRHHRHAAPANHPVREGAARHRLGFDACLHGSREQAEGLIRVPPVELMDHGQAESGNLVSLPS